MKPHSGRGIVDESSPSLESCIERALRLVGPKYGLIQNVEFESLEPGEPQVFFARTFPSARSPLNNQKSINFGDAVSTNPQRAAIKSLGECIERYASAYIEDEKLGEGTHSCLSEASRVTPIGLESLNYFTDEQYTSPEFPFSRLSADTTTQWVKCLPLGRGEPKLVPAQLVFVPFPNDKYGDVRLCDQISTGMACSPDKISSIIKGILEVIERDAFMIHWLRRIHPPEIEINNVRLSITKDLLKALNSLQVSARFYLLTLDINAHVILIWLENQSGVPPFTVMGLGADLDPEKALILALEETLLTFIGMGRYARANPDFTVGDHFKNIVTPTLHALAHAVRPELKNALEFLREPAGTVKFDELVSSVNLSDKNECLDFLVREVERQDLEPLYFNLTTEDIKFAGFQVARVVIPGMQPLDVNHNFRHLGVHRHLEVPEKLELRCQNEINPFPHPFP